MISITTAPEIWMARIAAFVFGLAFGSFLNVCIYRLPRGMSVVHPRSACPGCGAPVRSSDNIPVVSWLLLRGKCRDCKNPISIRYPIVELLNALLWLACIWHFGAGWAGIKFCVFSFLILGLIFTDADLKLLPDAMTLPGFWLGLLFSLLIPVDGPADLFVMMNPRTHYNSYLSPFVLVRLFSLVNALVGAAVGALFIWGVGALYKRIRGMEGMGFGDVKLMAMAGAFLGWELTMLTIVLGSLTGSVAGFSAMAEVYLKRKRRYAGRIDGHSKALHTAKLIMRHYQMPFGVFLGAMALFSFFFGERLVIWYMRLFL